MFLISLDIILFRKNIKTITYFRPFLFFVYLLSSLTNKWTSTTLSVFEEGAIEYIGPKYGLTVLAAFSDKFQLNFSLLFFCSFF